MKPYHLLPCKNLKEVQAEVLSWIESKNLNLLKSKSLWNKIDTLDLLSSTPALRIYLKSLNLKLRETSLTVVSHMKDIDLHIDELPVTAKINIPILNTQNTFNRWYEIPRDIMEKTKPIINKFGKKFYNFANINYSKLKLVGEVETIQPMVFNSQIAHNIIFGKNYQLPRVVLACTFFQEPIDYLKN